MNGLDMLRLIEVDIAKSPLEVSFTQLQEEVDAADLVRAIFKLVGVDDRYMPLNTFAEEVRDVLNRRRYDDPDQTIRVITEALEYYDDNQRSLYEVVTGEMAPDRCRKCRELYGYHKVYFIGPIPDDAIEADFGNGMRGYYC